VFAVSLLFFVVGLAALALAGAEHSRRIAAAYSRGLGLNRPWLGTVAGLILALLALGLALAELSAPGFGPLSALWEAVTTPLLIALALVMGFIVEPLFRLWEAWLTRAPAATPTPAATPAPLFQPDSSAAETLSPAMLNTVTAADLLILVSLLALAVWLVVHRWRVPKPADDGEVRDSVFSTSLLAEQLRALAARFRPRPAPEPPFLDLAGVAAARARIRRAFRAVLEQGQAAGLARAPGQTPQAYVGRLAEIWPDRRAALADLAGLYDLARYGADTDAPTEAQAQQAEQAAEPAAPPSEPA
ncbi:MAG: DUF4129 domain-containing protein, partial [Anaerolineales bacterium]|nr:DUF4129 domain-containing protein [Anaerolineales bacterium]